MTGRAYTTERKGKVNAQRMALRASIITQIDADLARIDRMIAALDLMDGDPDIEADYAFVDKDEAGNLAWFGTSTDQEVDHGEEPEVENEHFDFAETENSVQPTRLDDRVPA